ncbi:VEGF-E [Pseudocowpox virus]
MKLITTLQVAAALLICMYNLPECLSGSTGGSSGGGSSSASSLSSWLETTERSRCKLRDVVIDLSSELTNDISKYNPQCTVVKRCSGCCSGDSQICTAIETKNTTITVMKTKVTSTGGETGSGSETGSGGVSSNFHTVVVTEHTKCECRPKDTTSPTPTSNDAPRR